VEQALCTLPTLTVQYLRHSAGCLRPGAIIDDRGDAWIRRAARLGLHAQTAPSRLLKKLSVRP
jgi:hypothetical protein